jgi:hypothetical protein
MKTFASLLLLCIGLTGCANLEAVREFGKTAAAATAYPDAGKALQESAALTAPYRTVPALEADTAAGREAQVKKALALHATLSSYFATLAKLAGENAFSLDKELDSISKGLQALPGATNDKEIASAMGLVKLLFKYVGLRAQESAVRDLVDEGGAPAMTLLDALKRVTGNWRRMVAEDEKVARNQLSTLAAARDAPILTALLAKDRDQQLAGSYDSLSKRLQNVEAMLERIKAAHAAMEVNRTQLTSDQLRAALKAAVADLKQAQAQIAALH